MAGTQNPPVNGQGNINQLQKNGIMKKMGGSALNYGFIGVDSIMRMKAGESAPVAIGKAVLTNAAFSLLPGGIIGGMAIMGAMATPEIMNQMDRAAGGIGAKKQQFGGNFQQSEQQMAMMQQGVGSMQNARMHAAKKMANHARGAQRVY